MAVFFLAEIETITDADRYGQYREKVAPLVGKYGGTYVFRSNRLSPVSGTWDVERMVLLRFESQEQMNRCFHSPEYKEIAALREQSTISRAITIHETGAPQ